MIEDDHPIRGGQPFVGVLAEALVAIDDELDVAAVNSNHVRQADALSNPRGDRRQQNGMIDVKHLDLVAADQHDDLIDQIGHIGNNLVVAQLREQGAIRRFDTRIHHRGHAGELMQPAGRIRPALKQRGHFGVSAAARRVDEGVVFGMLLVAQHGNIVPTRRQRFSQPRHVDRAARSGEAVHVHDADAHRYSGLSDFGGERASSR